MHLFNPDNDMALAAFTPGFTPPAPIKEMMEELASFCPPGVKADEVWVWGWSPAACHRLLKMGCPPSLLPSRETLRRLRALSSRETAVELLPRLIADLGPSHALVGSSRLITSEAALEATMAAWGPTMAKTLWSSSGRGLRLSSSPAFLPWARRALRTMGGLVAEPFYPKVLDFAMLFSSDGLGKVSYEGLSLFEATSEGAYKSNLILPEEEKARRLALHVPEETLHAVRAWLEGALSEKVGSAYTGPLGVDMMVLEGGALHPLVEINLRATMGHVALALSRERPERRGRLVLEHHKGAPLPPYATLLAGGESWRIAVIDYGAASLRGAGLPRV